MSTKTQSNATMMFGVAAAILFAGMLLCLQMAGVALAQAGGALVVAIVAIAIALAILWQQMSSGGGNSGQWHEWLKEVAQGNWPAALLAEVPELKKLFDSLQQQHQQTVHLKRVAAALDVCQANVMIANEDLEICYLNTSVSGMLSSNQTQLQSVITGFDARRLQGQNIDFFHKDPAHQRRLLANLKQPYHTTLNLAGLTFDLIASPVFGDAGERIGTVVEWKDLTAQLALEKKTAEISEQNNVIRQALDVCMANVMMADNDFNITFMNKSAAQMLRRNEAKIRESLPNFAVDKLVGGNADIFHVNPAHQRQMVAKLTSGYNTNIKIGGLTFGLNATPVFNSEGQRIATVVEWYDRTDDLARQQREQQQARENTRIRKALDVCQANVMMADDQLNIVYVNDSVHKMLKGNAEQLRKQLSSFDADKLIGANIDVFHKNPAHQRAMLAKLDSVYKTQIVVAGLTFDLIATPVFEEGQRLGTVVEWCDVTEQLARQQIEQQQARENTRIRKALDVCQANVMMADDQFNIVYMNESVQKMLKGNAEQLRKQLGSFDADKLLGANIDVFHKNPAHQRGMLTKLTDVYRTQIEVAGLTFNLIATPVYENGARLGTVIEWEDVTQSLAKSREERRIASENLRVRFALDNVTTNTMIADANSHIIYMNESLRGMMTEAEVEIRKVLPHFDSRALIGQNMDVFHKNPAHQRGMIDRLQTTYRTEIKVGSKVFSLIANPIVNESGERLGTVVEWNDRTNEVIIENEVAELIEKAATGDLSARISEQGKVGYFLSLTQGLNRLVDIAEGVIGETVSMLDAMAHGDLTKRIETHYQGQFDKLKQDANATAEKLTEVLERISQAAGLVATGAEEIAQGNTDLSQRTEEQASSLEETASSMEEMTSTVKQNADNAKVADQLARDTGKQAKRGGEIVERAVKGMSEINQASKRIADIISVIDEIAFQTNLLALNAAVEAARAGEQGRGFAVVAGEVRNLAQRSAAAAKEIKDLIRDSVTKVEDGTLLVNQSGEMLKEIVDSVMKVSHMISDISSASAEQSTGIEQVNKAVSQMDEMTQQNAALVEEASAAGESMAEQARTMKQLLSFFTFNDGVPEITSLPAPSRGPSRPSKPMVTHQKSASKGTVATRSPSNFADDDDEWQEF